MVVTLFGVVILVFVFYPIWLLGIVFLMCMLKARSKTLEYANAITIENLHTQMYQNLKLTLFFLEDLGGMILIVSTKKNPGSVVLSGYSSFLHH
jgi:hypothetical protein